MFQALQAAAAQESVYKIVIDELKRSLENQPNKSLNSSPQRSTDAKPISPPQDGARGSIPTTPLEKAQAVLDSIISEDWAPPALPVISESNEEDQEETGVTDVHAELIAHKTTGKVIQVGRSSPQVKRAAASSMQSAGAVVGGARMLELEGQVKSLKLELRKARSTENSAEEVRRRSMQLCQHLAAWLHNFQHNFDSWESRTSFLSHRSMNSYNSESVSVRGAGVNAWSSRGEDVKVMEDVVQMMMQRVGTSLASFIDHLAHELGCSPSSVPGANHDNNNNSQPQLVHSALDASINPANPPHPLLAALTAVASACDELAHVALASTSSEQRARSAHHHIRATARAFLEWKRHASACELEHECRVRHCVMVHTVAQWSRGVAMLPSEWRSWALVSSSGSIYWHSNLVTSSDWLRMLAHIYNELGPGHSSF
jgi:hypothetical protein